MPGGSANIPVIALALEGPRVLVTAEYPIKGGAWARIQFYRSVADQPKVGDMVKVTYEVTP